MKTRKRLKRFRSSSNLLDMMLDPKGPPRLVGSTGDLYNGTIEARTDHEAIDRLETSEEIAGPTSREIVQQESNYFKSAQWYSTHSPHFYSIC